MKKGGFSNGYTVRDPRGREWSAKLYPEARTEVVASRILWARRLSPAAGVHAGTLVGRGRQGPNPQPVARFREEKPEFHGLKESGPWSYADNPFVGTQPLAGLLVLQVMLGNSDLKADNNMLYTLSRPVEGARDAGTSPATWVTRSAERASSTRRATMSTSSTRRPSSRR